MTCPCKSILGKKYTILVNDVDNMGGYTSMRVGSVWEMSVLPSPFCGKPKTKKVKFKKKNKKECSEI